MEGSLDNCSEQNETSTIQQWRSVSAGRSIVHVPVTSLQPADSPRISGESPAHVRRLVESEGPFPPIIAHRQTMKVIDGMHRLRAAAIRREDTIEVEFFDGSESDAFALAVHANISHGLPLSLAERKSAAVRLIESHPEWSDRLIATTAGLSHKTVGKLRRRATGDGPQLHERMGRDGRLRPFDGAESRRAAADLIRRAPNTSLREIARATGLSPGTVRDVRARMRRGEAPVTPVRRTHHPGSDTVQKLRNDPALRFSEKGRALLERLTVWLRGVDECERLLDDLPDHCAGAVSKLARQNAENWSALAERLEQRVGSGTSH